MSDNNFEDALSSILGNGDLMSKISEIASQNKDGDISSALPQIMSILSSNSSDKNDNKGETSTPVSKNTSGESENSDGKNDKENVGTDKTGDGAYHKKALEAFGKSISKNAKLLNALKPYLSKERAEMIDNIIRISQIADIMKLVK